MFSVIVVYLLNFMCQLVYENWLRNDIQITFCSTPQQEERLWRSRYITGRPYVQTEECQPRLVIFREIWGKDPWTTSTGHRFLSHSRGCWGDRMTNFVPRFDDQYNQECKNFLRSLLYLTIDSSSNSRISQYSLPYTKLLLGSRPFGRDVEIWRTDVSYEQWVLEPLLFLGFIFIWFLYCAFITRNRKKIKIVSALNHVKIIDCIRKNI